MMPENESIHILLVDDHPVFRYGMRALLTAMPDMVVVGEAASGAEALRVTEDVLPEVILMDIAMPGMNGIEATSQIRSQHSAIAILIVTMLEDDSVFAAMRAGARGYLLKGAEPAETVRAIRAVAHGEAIFSPGIAERVMAYFAHPPSPALIPAGAFPSLTAREREVLELLAQGLTNVAIAEKLVLSPKTVRNYISEIFSKLQVADRMQAIVRARESGLG